MRALSGVPLPETKHRRNDFGARLIYSPSSCPTPLDGRRWQIKHNIMRHPAAPSRLQQLSIPRSSPHSPCPARFAWAPSATWLLYVSATILVQRAADFSMPAHPRRPSPHAFHSQATSGASASACCCCRRGACGLLALSSIVEKLLSSPFLSRHSPPPAPRLQLHAGKGDSMRFPDSQESRIKNQLKVD